MSVFNGCNEDESVTPPTTVYPYLMITHASPDAPNVDILIGTSTVSSNVAYGTSTAYKVLSVGNNRVRLNATGTSLNVIDTTNFYQEGKSYSIFAMDSVNIIEPLVLTDDLTVPGSINANLRFVHLSPNTPAVDIIASTKTTPFFPDYEFKEFSSFRPVTAGTYTLEVRLANQSTAVLVVPNVTFSGGKIYTLYLKGFIAATGTQALGLGIINNN
ncbi:MAG TPA: DUF4397 domain-containing protein [Ignavibacteria bacterium]|nr:DUF4397 domain-containing protein [Ignavibacteria bacterium]